MEMENKDPTAEPVSLPLGFLRSITGDFCDEQELGRGGYGVVYKGILPCGSVIAVKKFHEKIMASDMIRSFEDEASFLMGIEHQNVVQLLGFCAESRGENMMKQQNRKVVVVEQLTRMLCFEYMGGGGLDEHLSDESSGLDWNTRYNIIKGICNGLKYLHGRNIIHRDLKPQNILMDTNMVPKIADFGLSKLLGEQQSYIVTSNLAGTLGYMAPEYINKGEISTKADIFSLGVIIIQILKGCKDGYLDKTDYQHFTEKVLSNWRKRFKTSSKYTAPELCIQLVKECIDIALKCVHPEKDERPNVSNIIEILNAAEGSFVQIGDDLRVDHHMGLGTQEGLPTSGLVAVTKVALKDHAQAWIEKGIMKSAVAPHQPQRETVLASADGSLAALRYQVARNASFWVAHKVLASLEDNMLKDWAATINLGPCVEALERELKSVKVMLEFTLGKVIHRLALEDILMVLGKLVHDAEDMLDEMEYFRIQGNVLDDSQHAEDCYHNMFLDVLASLNDEPPKLRFDRDNASRRMEHIVEQMQLMQQKVSSAVKLLGSDWSTVPNIAQNRPITVSVSIEPKLYGRELMMKSIIDDITKGKYSSEVLTVIPIVGPGGIGKTTLAQHIYHRGEVQEHFDVRVWTCVSLNFNVNKLIEEIQRYIPKVDHESSNGTAIELIGQRLKNKRLLLVLDDIWDCSDEDEWKRLLVPFLKSQVQGNIIIVTTRFPKQAHIMVSKNDLSIYLQGLGSEPFEELFLEIIFGDDDQSRKDHGFLLETGIKIAGRLRGSPLAAKTVGRLLKTQLDLVHWTRILESKEWRHSNSKDDIMPALKLSFDYLPCQLQQCLSYSSLFPQDYEFERQELINFWIGQEVLHSSHGENKRVEDIGLSCLTGLVNYGFLLEKRGEKDETTCYIIHDLLHELARKVSSLEFLSIDNSQSKVSSLQVLPSIRHLSINIDDTSAKDRLLTLKNCVEDSNTLGTRVKVEKLRTLMIFGKPHGCFVKDFGDIFREAKALRLVFLSGASYDVEDLLHNFYCLIHLRYLRIEKSSLYEARFRNTISRFYHMKVLDAKHCHIISDLLPRDINNLVKLRHLLVRDDTKHSSIIEVGKLKSLQELCGSLRIDSLENVQVSEESNEAKLMLKTHLHKLILHWDNNSQSSNDSTLGEHVLERLKPSRNLQELSIIGHGGCTCPSWLGMHLSLSNLKSLCLVDLWSVNVPLEDISINIPEKSFRNLRRLELEGLSGLKTWAVHAPCQLFPYLEVLKIHHCYQLAELSFSHSICCCQQGENGNDNLFSRLLKLDIWKCPQLSSFPPVPWTKAPCSTKIGRISSLQYLECEKGYDEYSLIINGKKDTNDSTFWNVLAFHNLTGLDMLSMEQCGSLPLHHLQMLSSLRTLKMTCPSNVFPFVEADNHDKYQFPVESLVIREWTASGMELTQLFTYFPKLSDLKLFEFECKKVTGLGVNVKANINKVEQGDVIVPSEEAERGLLLLPPQLQELEIEDCPELSLLSSNPHDDSNVEDGRSGGGGGGGLQGLTSLRRLVILYCPKLLSAYSSSSFSSSFPFPNSLEYLDIGAEVGTDVLPLSNLTSLTSLSLCECGDLRGKGLFSLLIQGHLTKINIIKMPNFFVDSELSNVQEQERPFRSKLHELKIDDMAGFTLAAIRHRLLFSALTNLEIKWDDKVESFTEEQEALLFVDSLEDVTFSDCNDLQFLPERLHRLSNLKRLHIRQCTPLQMLPKDGLPSSLQELEIDTCPKIQSLPKDCLPDALKKLEIRHCPAILSLPEEDDLPSSLREIDVSESESEELRRQCRKLINIIPIVKA